MWNGYYYKIEDSWVPPLYWAPRWLDANSYPTLTDYIEPPSNRVSLNTATFYAPSGSVIPYEWKLDEAVPSKDGSLMQKFFELFINEKQFAFNPLHSAVLSSQMFYDSSDPEFAWIVESLDPVDTLLVETSSGNINVPRANSDIDLFYSGNWRWRQDNNVVLIYGLDIQNLTDTVSGGWHFIDGMNKASSGTCLFMEHPITKNWFPIHPLKTRRDGMSNFYYDGAIRFRGASTKAAKLLTSVNVIINNEKKVARRVNLFNSVDEKALFVNLERKYGETNRELSETILKSAWFRGQTYRQTRSYFSSALRTSQLITVAGSASSFSLPASATGYHIKNLAPFTYSSEILTPVSPSGTTYYTSVASASVGYGFVRGSQTDMTVASGIVSFSTFIDASIDLPVVTWVLPIYSNNASSIFITENYPDEQDNFVVLFSSKVDVLQPSEDVLKKSFNRTSPAFKWQRDRLLPEVLTGLAVFDF